MRYIILSILLVVSHVSQGQHALTGYVVDAVSGQPVPYASLSVLHTGQGTTTNEEGGFELPAVPLPVKLIVSNLGHQRDTLTVTSAQPLRISLRPTQVLLPEVRIGNYAAELLQKAYRQLARARSSKTYGQAFYRQVTRLDGEATEVQEMIWHTKANNTGIEGTVLAHARYAEKKALISFKNFSFFTKGYTLYDAKTDSATTTAVVSLNSAQRYDLSVVGTSHDGSQSLVEIAFSSKPKVNPYQYSGSIIIDEATYQIRSFRLVSADSRAKSNNPTFAFKNPLTVFELAFQPLPDGSTRPEYIKVSYRVDIERPFKEAVQVRTSSFTYFYDGQPTTTALSYEPAGTQSDLAAIKKTTYDPGFWQRHAVVKRTPLEEEVIRSFEQKGAFGTLLTK